MRISDWSSDVCSSDLKASDGDFDRSRTVDGAGEYAMLSGNLVRLGCRLGSVRHRLLIDGDAFACHGGLVDARSPDRSEEHTSELQSLMRISYAVFCLKKKI